MIASKALKYPALVMGLVMFALFLTSNSTAQWWAKAKRRFIPSTCDSLVSRLESKSPKNWSFSCPTIDLLILSYDIETTASREQQRILGYKSIANTLVQFAKLANPETLEYLKQFRAKVDLPTMQIIAGTDGEAMLAYRDLNTPEKIANHIKLTVKVEESFK